jgi:hypothetical protein
MKSKQRLRKVSLFIIVVLLLTACGAGFSIKGKVIDNCTDNGELAKGATVSLAPAKDGQNFGVKLVDNEWQGETAATQTDNSGNFLFKDIPDGKYGLILLQAQVPNEQGDFMVIEVKKGSPQVLGDIQLVKGAEGNCKIEYKAP